MVRFSRIQVVSLLLFGSVLFAGCSSQDELVPPYRPPTSGDNVIFNLKTAYIRMDGEHYSELLADDFRFYFDPVTRLSKNLGECWNRSEDSTGTARSLLASGRVAAIRLAVECGPPDSVNEVGRENWLRIEGSADLEVDLKPDQNNPDGLTYFAENERQTFYFRRGRNAADTLASSPTAKKLFLVEWRDQGGGLEKPGADGSLPVARTTWSALKTMAFAPSRYAVQTTEVNVLHNLEVAYETRDGEIYPKILADDFRFYFDPETRVHRNLPEFWDRPADSTGTALSLLSSDEITDIRMWLEYSPIPFPVTDPGRERWTRINCSATIEADQAPTAGMPEGMTFQVLNDPQTFYFRKGRNPADTLASSPTSQQMYLVEWHDLGYSWPGTTNLAPMTARTTWSSVKTMAR